MTTIVALHAHPDDEVLLTGGTLAAAAEQGHRVILITATAGEAGLSDYPAHRLERIRSGELSRSARILGCREVIPLGYRDSGMSGENVGGFAHQRVEIVAERLAEVLSTYSADVLLGYDRNGGYGHPDHLQVHRVARFTTELLPRVRLLEATVDRAALQRAVRIARRLRITPATVTPEAFRHAFSASTDIGYRVDVGPWLTLKRRAMQAHRSQASGGSEERSLSYLTRLPGPLFRMAFQTEWFTDPRRGPEVVLPSLFAPICDRRPPASGRHVLRDQT